MSDKYRRVLAASLDSVVGENAALRAENERLRAAARCAIKAMLQPTVEMIDAGNAAVPGTVNADNIYMAMIREALK